MLTYMGTKRQQHTLSTMTGDGEAVKKNRKKMTQIGEAEGSTSLEVMDTTRLALGSMA